MTKEEKIKEEYGEDYDILQPNENGWSTKIVMHQDVDFNKYQTDAVAHGMYMIRPRSLSGIENNKGWISCKGSIEISNTNCFVYTDKGTLCLYDTYTKFSSICELEEITRYKPIDKPEPPVY